MKIWIERILPLTFYWLDCSTCLVSKTFWFVHQLDSIDIYRFIKRYFDLFLSILCILVMWVGSACSYETDKFISCSCRLSTLLCVWLMFQVSLLISSHFMWIIKSVFQQLVELGLSCVSLLSFDYSTVRTKHAIIIVIIIVLSAFGLVLSVEDFSSEKGGRKIMRY